VEVQITATVQNAVP